MNLVANKRNQLAKNTIISVMRTNNMIDTPSCKGMYNADDAKLIARKALEILVNSSIINEHTAIDALIEAVNVLNG